MLWAVDQSSPVPITSLHSLAELVRGRQVVALTGAGCSTESGIPDYRGPGTLQRARNPIQFREFIGDANTRRRYWARSVVGWPRIAGARPNPAHLALAALERAGVLAGVITQNVDGLHHAAGSARVVELHGSLHQVRCLECERREKRAALQERLLALNPGFAPAPAEVEQALRPDGDAELAGHSPCLAVEHFEVAACVDCRGVLKPDVVFFGENVPRPRVEMAMEFLGQAEVLLVAGSSLTVFSGYRFVREAERRGLAIAIVNIGPTRGDSHARVRVDENVATALPALARALLA